MIFNNIWQTKVKFAINFHQTFWFFKYGFSPIKNTKQILCVGGPSHKTQELIRFPILNVLISWCVNDSVCCIVALIRINIRKIIVKHLNIGSWKCMIFILKKKESVIDKHYVVFENKNGLTSMVTNEVSWYLVCLTTN